MSKIKIVIFFLFGFLLVSPHLASVARLNSFAPLSEKRKLAERPSGNALLKVWSDPDFGKKFENYFNDQFGTRVPLVRLKNQFDYSVFKKSDQVILGREQWLMDKSLATDQAFQSDHLSPEKWKLLMTRLVRLRSKLNQQGLSSS